MLEPVWAIPIIIISLLVGLLIVLYLEVRALRLSNKILTNNCDKILSQKKSSEVRLGRIGEQMSPFFESWPFDPNGFRFLGNPIDGIQFTDDAVIFIEIKTGKARLTDSQKTVKRLVKEGKVCFATFRIGEDGCSLKMEEE
jgi:predicted Holliday junction resolvase-like endonuclease